ncbi:FxLYD domain-containing protein [Candidatus Micrarchaeota archaeon]|nr:FxLYD domain-containing protein [Candidatus Micrarchaeota archaeon]
MRKYFVIFGMLILGLFLFSGCITEGDEAPPVEEVAVPETDDALAGAQESEQTVRGLTGDKCGSYITFNGFNDYEYSQLSDCYNRKYLTPAVKKKDSTICDEIYNPYTYGHCYGLVAFQLDDPTICDGIVNILFERRSGPDDATTIEACKIVYLEQYILDKRMLPSFGCEVFSTGDYIDICNDYIEKIKPATGIGSLYAMNEGPVIESYIILEDSEGDTQVEDGTLTVTILAETTQREVYSNEFDVKKEDFTSVALGFFEDQEIVYLIPDIDLSGAEFTEDECMFDCDLIFNVNFETTDGRTFEATEDIWMNEEVVLVRDDSECLTISNLRDDLVDESTQYSTYKYFVISGTVTNNCGSLKDFIEVKYTLYNANDVKMHSGFEYLYPSNLPDGYSRDFEVNLEYEGHFVEITELPDHYVVIADT